MALSQCSMKDRINRFFAGPAYIFILFLLSAAAHLMSLELVAYTVFTLIAVYICWIGNDFLPATPLLVFSYILPSARNNPGTNIASIFSGTWFLVLASVVGISLLYFFFRNAKTVFYCKRRLIWGMLALCAAYLLSGIGSAAYETVIGKNLVFATLQCACLVVPYVFLTSGVNWSSVRKDYLAWIGLFAGLLLCLEVIWSYVTGGVIVDGIINRKHIFTGWGMYNNIGAMLSMMIPFAFSLGMHHKKILLGAMVGFLFVICTIMTCSRTSLVAAIAMYGVCVVVALTHGQNRKKVALHLTLMVAVCLLVAVFLQKQLLHLFSEFFAKITDPSSRHILFAEGLKVFKEAPVLGSSFYSPGYQPWDFSVIDTFSNFFPPRWHNTIIQLLASCGIAGILAYGFHRFQTIRLFCRRKGADRLLIALSILTLLACSLLDCHFFNVGPVLFYSALLAFLEFSIAEK